MKYIGVASFLLYGDEVLSLIAVMAILFMGLFDIIKLGIEELEK